MAKRIIYSPKYYAVLWDFEVDGGAIGSYNTGLVIPAGGVLQFGVVQSLVTCVGVGASFTFGVAGALNLYGAYPSLLFGNNTTIILPNNTIQTEVLITIAGAPVTQGKLAVSWVIAVTVGR